MKEFKIRASQVGKIMGQGRGANGLSKTCISYLKEWYSTQMYGDRADIYSKHMDKGIMMEIEAIDTVAVLSGYGILSKNDQSYSDEHFTGTPDIITEHEVIDTKCSWDGKTFLESVTGKVNKDYELQLQVYMHLTGKKSAKLAYVLLDTPEECNYGNEVIYSDIEIEKRYYTIQFEYDYKLIEEIQQKVKACREWLKEYDKLVKGLLC